MISTLEDKSQDDGCSQDTILVVGLVCVDIILVCSEYPIEDSSNRAIDCFKRRGGNGSNSCSVLSRFKAKCELLAPLGGDDYAEFLKGDMNEHGIGFKHSAIYRECKTPFTNLIISLATGSRTGVHFTQNFPENSVEEFEKVCLSNYSWVHFEGRCVSETRKMMKMIDEWNEKRKDHRKLHYSVELEKCKEETKELIPLADYVFVSKDFARYVGFQDMHSAIKGLSSFLKPGAVIIVPWGEEGAIAQSGSGELVQSCSYPPDRVLDSIGAGDTFIAATIYSLSKCKPLHTAIKFGCWIAGAKVGMNGFTDLWEAYSSFQE